MKPISVVGMWRCIGEMEVEIGMEMEVEVEMIVDRKLKSMVVVLMFLINVKNMVVLLMLVNTR